MYCDGGLAGPKRFTFPTTGSLYEGIPHSAEGVETFLIVGVGDDEEERENTGLTDTIMLAVVDKAAQSVQILQIPRDTYVGDITPTGKINAITTAGTMLIIMVWKGYPNAFMKCS